MPTFEEALRASVQGMDKGFRTAVADLNREVAAASEAVEKLTNQRTVLEVKKADERPSGTNYQLRMRSDQHSFFEVAAFFITAKGYPIRAGRSVGLLCEGEYETEIKDVSELAHYFVMMASNPDSPLVLRIALLMRTPETAETA